MKGENSICVRVKYGWGGGDRGVSQHSTLCIQSEWCQNVKKEIINWQLSETNVYIFCLFKKNYIL